MDASLVKLLDLLDDSSEETANTSVRLPVRLRDAALVAADMGLVASTTELTVRGLRDRLEALAQRLVLDAHYEMHPDARPSLAEVAIALAEIDGNPLAKSRGLIRRAASEVGRVKPEPDAEDVLLYAAALASAA